MATQTRAARLAIAAIADYEVMMPLDSISDPSPLEKKLKEKGRVKTGKKGTSLEWKVQTARGSAGAMSPEATSTFTPVNPGVNLSLANRGYKTTDRVHEIDIEEASGKQQIFDIVENRTMWMPEVLRRARATEFYTGDSSTDAGFGTNGIFGLNNSIVTTGTYAGQNVATETALQGQVNSGGVHATFTTDPFPSLVDSIIDGMRGTDKGAGEYSPDICMIDPTGFAYILNAANDQRRAISHERDTKLGIEKVNFMGVEIIMDRFCPALKYYVLNTKYLELHALYGTLDQVRKREEISPLSVELLCFFYGKFVNRLPRAQVKTTYA